MSTDDGRMEKEILEAFYSVVDDFRTGVIDDETLKEKVLMLAKRYDRHFKKETMRKQAGLFDGKEQK